MDSLIFGIVTLELVFFAWIDIKTSRISNLWSLLNLIIYFVLLIGRPEIYPIHLSHFLFPVGFLIVGFVLFNMKIMGAGDSKLLSSLFLLTPDRLHLNLFENILYATLITGTIFLVIAITKNWKNLRAFAVNAYWKGLFEMIKSKFSYAPVIAIAWLLLGVKK